MNISKKVIVIGLVIALILAGIVFFITYKIVDDRVEQLYMGALEEASDGKGIKVSAYTQAKGYSSIDGKGRLTIYYRVAGGSGEEVYDEAISFKNDGAKKVVPYKDFVIDNGEYEFKVAYGDKVANDTTTINWVLSYLDIDTSLSPVRRNEVEGVLERGGLRIHMVALNGDGSFIFDLSSDERTDLDKGMISSNLRAAFSRNGWSLAEEERVELLEMNGEEWLIHSDLDRYLIREEDGRLKVYYINKGLEERILDATLNLKIYYNDSMVHEDSLSLTNEGGLPAYGGYDYSKTGSGRYRFEVSAENEYVKDDSEIYVTTVLAEDLNQLPKAHLGKNFIYNNGTKHYERSISISVSQAKEGYTVNFDGTPSIDDGPIADHQWDWDYYNDLDEVSEPFDVDETGKEVSHTFYPPLELSSHYYLGFKVLGENMVKEIDIGGGSHTERENDVVIIDLEFRIKITK